MTLQSIINSRLGIGLILGISKLIPPKVGFKLADWVAMKIASRKESQMVHSLRANQWVVTGQKLSTEELDMQVLDTFRHIAHVQYDLYHNLDNHQATLDRMILCPQLVGLLNSRMGGNEGTLILAPHLSNFDLAGRAMALNGYNIQVLSYPQPHGGYQWQNRLRKDIGIEISPMSTESLRRAKTRLKDGGFVISGLERPLVDTNYHPKFFGYPAPVPVFYVRLALQTNSAILIIACVGTPEENYTLECSDLIYLKPDDDPLREIERNAEKVLKAAEPFIRTHPEQWAMTYTVWPFALNKMP
ncbi:MAG: lysophospholipid acyltransferase family protein [Anaerolineaceae bacterium]|nr:lysophospholipid acyltransferase family protein [Anaerolineaceae bacterium]